MRVRVRVCLYVCLSVQAPEVYRQEKYNEKADVFSYAIIAYEVRYDTA